MKDSSASAKSSISAQLETLEKLSQSLVSVVKSLPGEKQDERLLQLSLKFACINFESLKNKLEKELAEKHSPVLDDPSSQFEELIKKLSENEKKIQDFKISLADAIMESRELSSQLQEKTEKCNSLSSQVSQMQLHTKDLSLKLSTANENIQQQEQKLETYGRDLQESRTRNLQLKNQFAEIEDQLVKITRQLEDKELKLAEMESEVLKAQKDLTHVVSSNENYKLEIETLELRASELEETIESLQREKNHLQEKFNKQLAGARRGVSYAIPQPVSDGPSVLEPSVFPAYLPFCFPERLPAPVRFRREIKGMWPASLKRASKSTPVIFKDFGLASDLKLAVRTQAKKPELSYQERAFFNISDITVRPFSSAVVQPVPRPVMRTRESFSSDYSILRAKKDISAYLVKSESKELKIFSNARFMPRKIFTTSFDLYLANLMQNSPNLYLRARKKQPLKTPELKITRYEQQQVNFPNIFTEKLAFRHRFQLQSQKLLAPGPKFTCSFRRGNKLKSVLETFGNTITSMVQKYDIVVSPPVRNGGTAK